MILNSSSSNREVLFRSHENFPFPLLSVNTQTIVLIFPGLQGIKTHFDVKWFSSTINKPYPAIFCVTPCLATPPFSGHPQAHGAPLVFCSVSHNCGEPLHAFTLFQTSWNKQNCTNCYISALGLERLCGAHRDPGTEHEAARTGGSRPQAIWAQPRAAHLAVQMSLKSPT